MTYIHTYIHTPQSSSVVRLHVESPQERLMFVKEGSLPKAEFILRINDIKVHCQLSVKELLILFCEQLITRKTSGLFLPTPIVTPQVDSITASILFHFESSTVQVHFFTRKKVQH